MEYLLIFALVAIIIVQFAIHHISAIRFNNLETYIKALALKVEQAIKEKV